MKRLLTWKAEASAGPSSLFGDGGGVTPGPQSWCDTNIAARANNEYRSLKSIEHDRSQQETIDPGIGQSILCETADR